MAEEDKCIVELCQKIKTIKVNLSPRKERQVISTRVVPILSILGWDSEDANAVAQDYDVKNHNDKRVDIALGENMEGPNRQAHVFVEVKASNQSLDKHTKQLDTYCCTEYVDLGVLTNGTEWHFYIYPSVDYPSPSSKKDPFLVKIDIRKDTDADCASTFARILSRDQVLEKRYRVIGHKTSFLQQAEQVWETLFEDREDIRGLVQRHLSKKRGKQVVKREKKWLEEWLKDKIMELHSFAPEGKSEESVTPSKSESEAKSKDKRSKAAASKVTHIMAFGEQIEVMKFTEAQLAFLQKLELKYPGSLERLAQEPKPVCFKNTNQMKKKSVPRQIGNMPYWAKMHRSAEAHRQTCYKALKVLGLPLDSVQFFNGDYEY